MHYSLLLVELRLLLVYLLLEILKRQTRFLKICSFSRTEVTEGTLHCSIIWSILLTSPTIYIHSVRSLNKDWESLKVNPVIFQSQVLVLQETMSSSTDCFNIPGHTLIGRIDGNARVSGSGTHINSRNPYCVNSFLRIKAVITAV